MCYINDMSVTASTEQEHLQTGSLEKTAEVWVLNEKEQVVNV